MDKGKNNNKPVPKKIVNLIQINDLLPCENVKGGSGKIVFGENALRNKRR